MSIGRDGRRTPKRGSKVPGSEKNGMARYKNQNYSPKRGRSFSENVFSSRSTPSVAVVNTAVLISMALAGKEKKRKKRERSALA